MMVKNWLFKLLPVCSVELTIYSFILLCFHRLSIGWKLIVCIGWIMGALVSIKWRGLRQFVTFGGINDCFDDYIFLFSCSCSPTWRSEKIEFFSEKIVFHSLCEHKNVFPSNECCLRVHNWNFRISALHRIKSLLHVHQFHSGSQTRTTCLA